MDENQRIQFFAVLAVSGRPLEACFAAGVPFRDVKKLQKSDPEFAYRYEESMLRFCETLQAEAVRRGRDGVDEPVFGSLGGNMGSGRIGEKRVYSDQLLMMELKRRDPSYRERMTVDANLTGGVLVVGPVAKSTEQWKKENENAVPEPRPEVDAG
jgi:hypothetical protein